MESLTPQLKILLRWKDISDSEKEAVCLGVIAYFDRNSNDIEAIAALAQALAASGEIWSWPSNFQPLADVPSTGGPGSLTTLLCPYILAACGCFVPKVSVRGSMAGALDVLELIEGFKSDLDRDGMLRILGSSNIAHTSNTLCLAPADSYLFQLRKGIGKKSVASLVIASLLSKKVAVSCISSAIDVRCGHAGNLGEDSSVCKHNADLFVKVAARLGMSTSCVVTDMAEPGIPFLGRSESLVGLNMALSNRISQPWLADHLRVCIEIAAEALRAAKIAKTHLSALDIVQTALSSGHALVAFRANIEAQGGSIQSIATVMESYESQPKQQVSSRSSGYLLGIRLDRLIAILGKVNGDTPGRNDRVGLACLKRVGDPVEKGETLFQIRSAEDVPKTDIQVAATEALEAFEIQDKPNTVNRSGIIAILPSPVLERPDA